MMRVNISQVKQCFKKPALESILMLFFLCIVFITPFFVDEELFSSTRSSKIFFFVKWMILVIPVGIYYIIRNWRDPINTLTLFVFVWLVWILLRGKNGGIWNDEKFFWYAGCFALFFILETILRNILNKEKYLLLIPAIVITIVAAIEAILGILQLYGKFHIYHWVFRVSGTFFNPAPYIGFLLTSMPFAFYLTSYKRDRLIYRLCYFLGYSTILLIILVLPATRSRAGFLGILSVIIVWLNYRYKPVLYLKNLLFSRRTRILVFTFVPIIFVLLSTGLYLIKKDSADGRLLIWKVILETIYEKPIIGHGFNTVQANLAPAQATYFSLGKGKEGEELLADNVRWAFNEPLQLTSETGIVGLLIFLIVISFALFYKIPKTYSRKIYLKIGCARASIFGVLVFGFFSYPFYSLPINILFFYSLTVLSFLNNDFRFSPYMKSGFNVVLLIGMVMLVGLYLGRATELKKAYSLWGEAKIQQQMNDYNSANKCYIDAYPQLKYNGRFLEHYAILLNEKGENRKSNELLIEARNYYCSEQNYITMGKNYMAIGEFDKAEKQFKIASNMVPHRFNPLYLLAKMYDQSGQKEKAVNTAKEILRKEVKVESATIVEMKDEMKQIIAKE